MDTINISYAGLFTLFIIIMIGLVFIYTFQDAFESLKERFFKSR
ncbi:hypothetical protein VIS19158_11563 [Vibrio scophthalmi LMG 19158]|uniref:Uncharacterized protein n=1 Tax=Vibrio scophthalmi LMG 19158 TaxID=870967 RepID=F9RIA0_9VIBR|nr:hypothetical protein VIS19158_11563 [Vibrio scophthalmi LMG 19158]